MWGRGCVRHHQICRCFDELGSIVARELQASVWTDEVAEGLRAELLGLVDHWIEGEVVGPKVSDLKTSSLSRQSCVRLG
eukprot:7429932-Heterocapsa_arctica.AAC.1